MVIQKSETVTIATSNDVVLARQAARKLAADIGFGLVDQTKIVTATSELARNTLEYGGGGTLLLEWVQNERRQGIRLTFEDKGPGIPDIDLALQDGYTTSSGMGLGLSGSRRLMSDFHISSTVGEGTTVRIARWI